MNKNISPLRYPGGKRRLTPFLVNLLKHNHLYNLTYIEPFAGGAASALNLLFLEYVYDVVINDADYSIYCFWKSILDKNEEFKKRIQDIDISIDVWQYQKEILSNPRKYKLLDVGFAVFFLNRCNRSGIIKAGPIGGIKQSSKWKIDARFNKEVLINKIEMIYQYRNRIKVSNLDAIDLIKKYSLTINSEKNNKYFFYLDPPYYIKGKQLYLNYYNHEDHALLANYIQKKIKSPWVLTYDYVPEIKELYKNRLSVSYNLNYSANIFKIGKEVMFFSDILKVPEYKIIA